MEHVIYYVFIMICLNYWNKKINLVSRKSIEISWERHFLDSAQLWLHLPYKARKWLDFGSGAGFPALVLAVISRELQPELKFILVEKNKKKAGLFIRNCKKNWPKC